MLHFYGHQTGYGRAGHMGGGTTIAIERRSSANALFAVAATLALSGCAGGSEPAVPPPALGLRCVDDSAHCISQREKVFDSYMADKSRAWIKQPAAPEAYASGVRLFALSKRRKDLSCDELAMGKRETDGAPSALRGSGGSRLTPAQVSRSVMLAGDVGRELAKEISRRCGKT
jgi:hypothetical protein